MKKNLQNQEIQIKTIPRNLEETVFFNTCFDKTVLKNLIALFLDQYGQKLTVELVETLKQVGFHQATQAGVSLGIDDLLIPPQKGHFLSQATLKKTTVIQSLETGNVTSVEKSQRLIDTWNQTSETLRQSAVQNFRATNPVNPVYMMAFSGARGNISQVRQLVGMRGLMADPQGAILEFPIQSNFREGLTVSEYLISCFGARKGLVDTALRTATSGYLTRRLVDAVQHVVVQISDCYSQKGRLLKGPKLEERLIGRVLLTAVELDEFTCLLQNTIITAPLAHRLASRHTKIWVRSPLTCETEKSVCQFCYGLDLGQGKLVSLGEAVGIIAAQSIGEPGTQLTMRTFHTGGVGVFSEQALKSFLAPFAGKVEFLDPLPGRFVRTPHGNIVYLLKHKTSTPTQPLLRLSCSSSQNFGSETTDYKIFHGEIPAGSILWVKHGESVKAGQLLIQASRLETTSQEMPESSHSVVSPISGEIRFERMLLRSLRKRKFSISQKKFLPFSKEIKPSVPVLFRLGKFWVFSSSLQHESELSKAFFRKGDLFSSETPLQQYNLHFSLSGQVKRLGSNTLFGYTPVELSFSKLSYSELGYFFTIQKESTNSTILYYTKNGTQLSLTWYPSFQKGSLASSQYIFRIPFQKDDTTLKTTGLPVKKSSFGAVTDVSKFEKFGEDFQRKKLVNLQTKPEGTPCEFFSSSSQVFCPTSRTHKELTLIMTQIGLSGKEKSSFFLFSQDQAFSEKGFFSIESLHSQPQVTQGQKEQKSVKNSQGFTKNSFHLSCKNQSFGLKKFNSEFAFSVNSLEKVHSLLKDSSNLKLIQHQTLWVCVPERFLFSKKSHKLKVLLQPGKFFEKFQFSNSFISVTLLHPNKIGIVQTKTRKTVFYSKSELLTLGVPVFKNSFLKTQTLGNFSPSKSDLGTSGKFLLESDLRLTKFSFYRKNKNQLVFVLKRKQEIPSLVCFQKLDYSQSPDIKKLKDDWLEVTTKKKGFDFIKSPLFTKQRKTTFQASFQPTFQFQPVIPEETGWFSSSHRLQINLTLNSAQSFSTPLSQSVPLGLSDIFFTKQSDSTKEKSESCQHVFPKLQFFFSQKVNLGALENSPLQTFSNGWLVPHLSFAQAFRKSTKMGEFRKIHEKNSKSCVSFLQSDDLHSFTLPGGELNKQIPTSSGQNVLGVDVRSGDEFLSGWALPESGRLVKLTQNSVMVRKGIPFLASVRGLLHTRNSALVEKNDLLVTLRSRRLQTEDIVQGIPKIEQLFEARETRGGQIIPNNMHFLLRRFFDEMFTMCDRDEAIESSLLYINNFLVQTIRDAYSTQGVDLAEKHIEIVVRQMTGRVRILEGYDTGLFSGEFIQRNLLEKVNKQLLDEDAIPATYEPAILGITKSVLQSESFLLAASFQQVSRVLVRSALAKKMDFLRGLHENLLVGQLIPAGTGTLSLTANENQSRFPGLPDSEDTLEKHLLSMTLENEEIIDVDIIKSIDDSQPPNDSQSPDSQ